ncbi:MAG TPA: hypothetical protein VLD62_03605 [Acidimicrobiia bacterium]|nr:hypothetical protein [Acidimicrobiia bacterium]HSG78642.1 hypothetical protein [Acidimicrobiia bacterium]
MEDTTIDRLERVLGAAGTAHHAAFAATDGADPEWPEWYADHVLDDVRTILDSPGLTRSRLVRAFVAADDAYTSEPVDVAWPRFYAERFARDLG